jgi:hypothetical protein
MKFKRYYGNRIYWTEWDSKQISMAADYVVRFNFIFYDHKAAYYLNREKSAYL